MNLAPTRGHCRLGTYGCNGSCAVKGCLIDKYAFQKKEPGLRRRTMWVPGLRRMWLPGFSGSGDATVAGGLSLVHCIHIRPTGRLCKAGSAGPEGPGRGRGWKCGWRTLVRRTGFKTRLRPLEGPLECDRFSEQLFATFLSIVSAERGLRTI